VRPDFDDGSDEGFRVFHNCALLTRRLRSLSNCLSVAKRLLWQTGESQLVRRSAPLLPKTLSHGPTCVSICGSSLRSHRAPQNGLTLSVTPRAKCKLKAAGVFDYVLMAGRLSWHTFGRHNRGAWRAPSAGGFTCDLPMSGNGVPEDYLLAPRTFIIRRTQKSTMNVGCMSSG
jgi:hypothetical protein